MYPSSISRYFTTSLVALLFRLVAARMYKSVSFTLTLNETRSLPLTQWRYVLGSDMAPRWWQAIGPDRGVNYSSAPQRKQGHSDVCINGMVLNIAAYFGVFPPELDVITDLLMGLGPVFAHHPQPGYPIYCWGTAVGAHSLALPIPPVPAIACLEVKYSSFPARPLGCYPSAGFMVTYF